MVYVQTEVILDSSGDRAGVDLRLGIRGNGQLDGAVHGVEFNRGSGELIELRLQMAVDGRKFGLAGKIIGFQAAIDAGGVNVALGAGDVQ